MRKRKTRFNILDFLFILAVIALVAGVMWRQELTDKIEIRDSENTVTVFCEFELVRSDGDVGEVRFEDGSTVIYKNDAEIGSVEKTTTGEESSEDESGEQGSKPVKVEKMRLKLSVVSKESGYYLQDGEKLFIGGEYRLHTKTGEFTVRISSVVAE